MKQPATAAPQADALTEIDRVEGDLSDFVQEHIALPDGRLVSVASVLNDLRDDHAAEMVVDALTEVAMSGERH